MNPKDSIFQADSKPIRVWCEETIEIHPQSPKKSRTHFKSSTLLPSSYQLPNLDATTCCSQLTTQTQHYQRKVPHIETQPTENHRTSSHHPHVCVISIEGQHRGAAIQPAKVPRAGTIFGKAAIREGSSQLTAATTCIPVCTDTCVCTAFTRKGDTVRIHVLTVCVLRVQNKRFEFKVFIPLTVSEGCLRDRTALNSPPPSSAHRVIGTRKLQFFALVAELC